MQDLQPGPIISQAGKILGWGSLYPGSRSSVLQVFIARLVPAVGINTDAMVQGTLETWIKSRFPMPITIYSDFQTWVLQFTQNNPNALPMLTFDLPPGQIFPNQTDLHFWQWAWGQAVSKAQAPAQVSGTVSGPCPECGQDHGQVGAAAMGSQGKRMSPAPIGKLPQQQPGIILPWDAAYPGTNQTAMQVFISRLQSAIHLVITSPASYQGVVTKVKAAFPNPSQVYALYLGIMNSTNAGAVGTTPMRNMSDFEGGLPPSNDTNFWQWAWGRMNGKRNLSDLYAGSGSMQDALAQGSGIVSGPCPDCGQDHGQVGAAAVQIPRTSLNASTALGGLWKATGVKSAAAVNKGLSVVLWEAPCEFWAFRSDEGLPYIAKKPHGVPATYMGALLAMINVWNLLPSVVVPPSQIAEVVKGVWPTPDDLVAELSKIQSTSPGGNPFHSAQSLCNFMSQGEINLFMSWPFMQKIVQRLTISSPGTPGLFPPSFNSLPLVETFTWNEVVRSPSSSYDMDSVLNFYYKRVRDANDLMIATPASSISVKKKIQNAVARPIHYRFWWWALNKAPGDVFPVNVGSLMLFLIPDVSEVDFWKWVWKIANGNISNQELIARNQAGFHFPKPPVIA